MSTLAIGLLYGGATLAAMFVGIPIAFALGTVAIIFMFFFMPHASLDTVTQNVYEEMALDHSLVDSAVHSEGRRDRALARRRRSLFCAACVALSHSRRPWYRQRVCLRLVRGDGGFVARDLLGHRLGRHSGNAQTRLFAGVRGGDHRGRRHARHPAAAVDHHDPLCRRIGTIARPAFPCRHRPGLLLVGLFAIYATFRYAAERRTAVRDFAAHGRTSSLLTEERYTLRERLAYAPRVLPFVLLLTGVMIALYGGYATPSETAGFGAILALVLIAIIYFVWKPSDLQPILAATLRESTMLMMIIGMSLLYSYVMSYLHISQSAAESIVAAASRAGSCSR